MTELKLTNVCFLIVDDLAENLIALEALLRRPGLEILQARSGQEALELLLIQDVALALVDVQMPLMNGFELAEFMRGTERTRRVPIIFVTAGGADRQRRFRGYEAGAVDFLNKPIEPDVLRSKAEVFFDLYRQRQEVAQQRDELKAATERIQSLLQESQQQAAALREADHRKDEFLATLAHELRNPLAPIRNAVEILKLQCADIAEASAPIQIASRQIRHMARLIDDLLDVARIAKGKIELRVERCNICEIVRNTAEDYRASLNETGVALELDLQAEHLEVVGDTTRIAQMVGNLLHNAGKFTPSGGRVTVQVRHDIASNEAVISIIDSGAGFEMSDADRLFEPFSQMSPSSEDRKGGLGLGLALTKGLAALHRGALTGHSDGPGRGATFTLHLPMSRLANSARQTQSPAVTQKTDGLSILVVEDNPDSARSLQLLLSLHGHQVEVAHDGTAGVSTAKQLRPDVVISDLGLPGEVDGYTVAEQLRAEPALRGVYLVALSGYGREDDRKRTQAAGFDQHLTKPLDLSKLKKILAGVSPKKLSS